MIPYVRGVVTKQAHVGVPDGLYEEEYGREGFFGDYAHIYREHSPVGWTNIEGPLKPRSYSLSKLDFTGNSFLENRKNILFNNDLKIDYCLLKHKMNYCFRNADGDDLFFVHSGHGKIFTDFGTFTYEVGDYIQIPKGCVYLLSPESATSFLIIESNSKFNFPQKGLLGHHALFDPAILEVPDLDKKMTFPQSSQFENEYELIIKRNNLYTRVHYPYPPITTVGWKGTLSPIKLNVKDIRPLSCERYHLPPSAHTTFVAKNFVICSFLPRPLETGDEKAMKVPFYHSNIDFDEVLFYHSGDFFSKEGIDKTMITHHPSGIHHGPHKGAVEKAKSLERTDEIAVMIDTRNPLVASDDAESVENKNYWKSWKG